MNLVMLCCLVADLVSMLVQPYPLSVVGVSLLVLLTVTCRQCYVVFSELLCQPAVRHQLRVVVLCLWDCGLSASACLCGCSSCLFVKICLFVLLPSLWFVACLCLNG
jgi:hypothetical protein